MSEPNEQQQPDDLDLEAETVKDLEASEETTEEVRGGAASATCDVRQVSAECPSRVCVIG